MEKIKEILDKQTILRSLKRISHEILEKNKGTNDLVIIGIQTKGVSIAKVILENIESIEGETLPFGELNIGKYRDDLLIHKIKIGESKIDFSLENKKVILIDDVVFTGRSVRAALDALMEFGRPREVQLATLIDRGHRELPIRPDYVGKNIPTSKSEKVLVKFNSEDVDGVYIEKSPNES